MGHPDIWIISPENISEMGAKHLQMDDKIQMDNDSNHKQALYTVDIQSKDLVVFPLSCIANISCHITHVNIDHNRISQLPAKISEQLPLLEVFTASGNELSFLPDDFGELLLLKELCLCDNNLELLPDSLSKLTKLCVLKLNANRLKRLHAEIGQNVSLEVVSVDENKLRRLPATIGLLRNLRILEASCNVLEALPSTIDYLKSLRVVDFSNNRLTHIPESFGDLKNLTHIDLSENKLDHLCDNFLSIKTLQFLYLDLNVFSICPKWFKDLENIVEISIKCNRLSGLALPEGFGLYSQQLKILDLRGNYIQELPVSFGHLASLESLLLGIPQNYLERSTHVQNGNWLSTLPYNFAELICLTKLFLDDNQLRSLPEDIGQLIHLQELFIGSNVLVELPLSFTKLVALKKCQISKNQLRKIPEDIGALELLAELYLNCNKLKTLPKSMKNLTNLELLDLSHNKLKQMPLDIIASITSLKSLNLDNNRFVVSDCDISNIVTAKRYKDQNCEYSTTNKWQNRHKRSEVIKQSSVQVNYERFKVHDSRILGETHTNNSSDGRIVDSEDTDEEDWKAVKYSSSSSSDERRHSQPDVEEFWDVEQKHDNDSSELNSGQFDLDDAEPTRLWFIPDSIKFNSYGICYKGINLDTRWQSSAPYIYHAPSIERFLYVPDCEVPGQFHDDISGDDHDITSGDAYCNDMLCSGQNIND